MTSRTLARLAGLAPVAALALVLLPPGAPASAAPVVPDSPAAAAPVEASGPVGQQAYAPDGRRSEPGVELVGGGYGHGHGMSQWGAEGAARQGLSASEILDFYYPGTGTGRADGPIRVLLTRVTTPRIVVRATPTLRAGRIGHTGMLLRRLDPHAVRWRLVPDGRATLLERTRGGAWHRAARIPGEAHLTAGAPIAVRTGTTWTTYRGAIRSVTDPATGRRVAVDRLPLEAYLRGVVPSEVPASVWRPASVQAQAVAARTYAAFERDHAHGPYDLCDTAACQVYGGVDAEYYTADDAVRATAGQVRTYGGAPIFAQFSASNGGAMSDGGYPYLVAKPDRYDTSDVDPYYDWTASVSAQQIEHRWPAVGTFTGLTIDQGDGSGRWQGWVESMTISGVDALGRPTSVQVTGDAFRIAFGLRSTLFDVSSVTPDTPAS